MVKILKNKMKKRGALRRVRSAEEKFCKNLSAQQPKLKMPYVKCSA